MMSLPRTFQLTGFRNEERASIVDAIRKLSGAYVDRCEFWPDTTHLICQKPCRSEKFLGACILGRWILTARYVTESIKCGYWLEELEFEWSITTPTNIQVQEHFLAAPNTCRRNAASRHASLFKGWNAVIFIDNQMKSSACKKLIELGGGMATQAKLPLTATSTLGDEITHIFVSERQLKFVQQYVECAAPHLAPEYIGETILKQNGADNMANFILPKSTTSSQESETSFTITPAKRTSTDAHFSPTPTKRLFTGTDQDEKVFEGEKIDICKEIVDNLIKSAVKATASVAVDRLVTTDTSKTGEESGIDEGTPAAIARPSPTCAHITRNLFQLFTNEISGNMSLGRCEDAGNCDGNVGVNTVGKRSSRSDSLEKTDNGSSSDSGTCDTDVPLRTASELLEGSDNKVLAEMTRHFLLDNSAISENATLVKRTDRSYSGSLGLQILSKNHAASLFDKCLSKKNVQGDNKENNVAHPVLETSPSGGADVSEMSADEEMPAALVRDISNEADMLDQTIAPCKKRLDELVCQSYLTTLLPSKEFVNMLHVFSNPQYRLGCSDMRMFPENVVIPFDYHTGADTFEPAKVCQFAHVSVQLIDAHLDYIRFWPQAVDIIQSLLSINRYPPEYVLHKIMRLLILKSPHLAIAEKALRLLRQVLSYHPPVRKMAKVYLHSFLLPEDEPKGNLNPWEFIEEVLHGCQGDVKNDEDEQSPHLEIADVRHRYVILLTYLVTLLEMNHRSSLRRAAEDGKGVRACKKSLIETIMWPHHYSSFVNEHVQFLVKSYATAVAAVDNMDTSLEQVQTASMIAWLVTMVAECNRVKHQMRSSLVKELASCIYDAIGDNVSKMHSALSFLQPTWLCSAVASAVKQRHHQHHHNYHHLVLPSVRLSPLRHGGHLSPQRLGGHLSPHRYSGHLSPHRHSGHLSPHRHSGHLSPRRHIGHLSVSNNIDYVSQERHSKHLPHKKSDVRLSPNNCVERPSPKKTVRHVSPNKQPPKKCIRHVTSKKCVRHLTLRLPGKDAKHLSLTKPDKFDSRTVLNKGKSSGRKMDINKKNYKGETRLHLACMRNRLEEVRELLQTPGILVNARDNAGWTALHEACARGWTECVQVLLDYSTQQRGGDVVDIVAKADKGITPLHDAVQNNHLNVVKLLLQHGGRRLLEEKNSLWP